MSEEENEKDKKKNDYSFYKKVIFVGIVFLAIYYIISPYKDCRSKYYTPIQCGENGLFW